MSEIVDHAEPEDEPGTESVAEPAQVRTRNRRIKLTQARSKEWVARQLADPEGRKWFWGLLQQCGTFDERRGAAPNGQPDDRLTDFHAGRRDVGLALWRSLVRADPVAVGVMHQENDG